MVAAGTPSPRIASFPGYEELRRTDSARGTSYILLSGPLRDRRFPAVLSSGDYAAAYEFGDDGLRELARGSLARQQVTLDVQRRLVRGS